MIFCDKHKHGSWYMSQPERINPLLTDSLRQIQETLRQFLTGLPRLL